MTISVIDGAACVSDKCRAPYKGGCAELNRECSYTELDASCDECIAGYTEVVGYCVQGQLKLFKSMRLVINIIIVSLYLKD